MGFYAQGESREVQGWKGAVQGSQMDPLDGPIAGLVEGDTFIRTPFSAMGLSTPPEKYMCECEWGATSGV